MRSEGKMSDVTSEKARAVLDLDIGDNDSGAPTVRGYLLALLAELWREEQGFSGKRPFGNSGWQYDIYKPMVAAGLATGTLDADGYLDTVNTREADALILAAIAELGAEAGAMSGGSADADAPEPLIVSEDPVLNGPRLSWYASMSKAEYHHDTLTASRDGVLPDGNTFLHQITPTWLSAAVRAYGLLWEGKAGEALAMATHERLDGRIVEVVR
jgi:hypothetical protein